MLMSKQIFDLSIKQIYVKPIYYYRLKSTMLSRTSSSIVSYKAKLFHLICNLKLNRIKNMLRVCTVVLLPFMFAAVNAKTISYLVNILPLRITPTTTASGFVSIFTDDSSFVIGYAGIVQGVEPNLLSSACNATNGCGVHIHSGRSCYNTTTQLGHYFNNASLPIDPWINERYSSDAAGKANFQSIIQIGTVDIEGRAFIGMFQNAVSIMKCFECNRPRLFSHLYFTRFAVL